MKSVKELIEAKYDEVISIIKEAEACAYRCPYCEYRAWIANDGETGMETWAAGDNGWFKFQDSNYKRNYIYTANHEYYNILWDWWFENEKNAKDAFKERFEIDLEIDANETLKENIYRQAKDAGFWEDEINTWLDEQKEEAISEIVEDSDAFDIDEIISQYIADYEEEI